MFSPFLILTWSLWSILSESQNALFTSGGHGHALHVNLKDATAMLSYLSFQKVFCLAKSYVVRQLTHAVDGAFGVVSLSALSLGEGNHTLVSFCRYLVMFVVPSKLASQELVR